VPLARETGYVGLHAGGGPVQSPDGAPACNIAGKARTDFESLVVVGIGAW